MANVQSRLEQLRQLDSTYQQYELEVKHSLRFLHRAENEGPKTDGDYRFIDDLKKDVDRWQRKSAEVWDTIRKLEQQLTPEERKVRLEEQKRERDLAQKEQREKRAQREQRERDLAEKEQREQQEKRERDLQEAKWRAEGRCVSCGRTLGFWDKLFGRIRCKGH